MTALRAADRVSITRQKVFYRPTDIEDAAAFLAERPEAVPIAGGTDLMVGVNYRQIRPAALLDLTGIAELREWRDEGAAIRLGAGLPYARIVAELATVLPGLAAASRTVGSPQIRYRGTVGGNLATASPAGDAHPPLLATGATVEIASVRTVDYAAGADSGPTGESTGAEAVDRAADIDASAALVDRSAGAAAVVRRTVPIADFYTGPKRSVLRPGELITAVTVPKATGPQQFLKVGTRNAMVIAVCSFALAVDPERRTVGTGIGSAGPVPLRAPAAETIDLPWAAPRTLSGATARQFGALVAEAAKPIDDVRGTADYRRHALAVCAERALRRTWRAAFEEGDRAWS